MIIPKYLEGVDFTGFNLYLPGQIRYQPIEQLGAYFGHDVTYAGVGAVELANLDVLREIEVIPAEDYETLSKEQRVLVMQIRATEVDEIERKLKHDIRAWLHRAQQILDRRIGRWGHIPLTSYDALESGRQLTYVSAFRDVIRVLTANAIQLLGDKAEQFANNVQIGRSHGQHGLPITVGFWLATILYRCLYNIKAMEGFSNALVGKISGAMGPYNAQVGMRFLQRCGFSTYEECVLAKIGLKPSPISTQILPPEPLAYFLFSAAMLSASIAQFGRDCRHLMRTEIGEVAEDFGKDQVGSSTMAHKRNPVTFEQLEGTWLRTKNELGKVLDSLISEHQRDLVGSSLMRDFPIILVNLVLQLNALLRKDKERKLPFLQRISINDEALQRNLAMSANVVLGEPMYIAIQMAGYTGDAHNLVNHQLVPIAQRKSCSLVEALADIASNDTELAEVTQRIPTEIKELLLDAKQYIGLAPQKTREIVEISRAWVGSF